MLEKIAIQSGRESMCPCFTLFSALSRFSRISSAYFVHTINKTADPVSPVEKNYIINIIYLSNSFWGEVSSTNLHSNTLSVY